jgi:hypothetical protein
MLGVGDDVREAAGAHREDSRWLLGAVEERVQPGTSLETEDEVAGASSSSPSCFWRTGRPLRTKNISSAPKCMCSRWPAAPGGSSYSVDPILAWCGRQKMR